MAIYNGDIMNGFTSTDEGKYKVFKQIININSFNDELITTRIGKNLTGQIQTGFNINLASKLPTILLGELTHLNEIDIRENQLRDVILINAYLNTTQDVEQTKQSKIFSGFVAGGEANTNAPRNEPLEITWKKQK